MRELRVIGVTPDSTHIVCVDTESGQKFRLPADDKLRAAARGDLARFGQIEIEMEASMRPRDIQARIRAGASVEQVTLESGMPASKVDRFAYPVLLERARAAELAQKAHPVRADGPAVENLIDIVTAAFTARGHTLDHAEWDAWKDEKGFWVAQLQWQNGRSEIAAHWRYQPDAHGGSVSPLDDPASDLIDPDFGRALRGLASILPSEPEPVAEPAPREQAAPAAEFREQRAEAEEPVEQPEPEQQPAARVDEAEITAEAQAPQPAADEVAPAAEAPRQPARRRAPARRQAPAATAPVAEPEVTAEPTEPVAPEEKSEPAAKQAPKPPAKPARTKRGKAPMPSWEDVLLGVRSSGH
ncbi:septation protein SepH [Nocardia harenae]|uniref:septation protein SepH n=1 Tax=Nocardia harenae TaxID=358707 RepID=UPI0008321034|nr:septation protein SepH [Nocardia harenae]